MMDLDNLKQINDTYGHDWGDQYIRQTGQCFAANTPANTICSRLSGDEFLIFFYGYQDQNQLRAQLELLSTALQRSVSILPNGKQLHISISGGIAWYPTDGHDLLTLKKYADFAMYQVKHSHKGRMCDFDIGSYHQEAYAAQTQQDFELLLQLLYAFFCIGELFFQHFAHLFVGFLLKKHQALFDGLFLCFIVLICVCDRLEFCLLLHQLLELRRIGSDVRLA